MAHLHGSFQASATPTHVDNGAELSMEEDTGFEVVELKSTGAMRQIQWEELVKYVESTREEGEETSRC